MKEKRQNHGIGREPKPSLEAQVFVSLLRAADSLTRGAEALLKPSGLSGTQYNVLRILRGAGPDGLLCREIGCRMISRDPDITRLLNRLEDRGLVERTRDKSDRRVIFGKVTSAGVKLLREMDAPLEKRGREMLRHVSQEKLKQLIELLELVRATKSARH